MDAELLTDVASDGLFRAWVGDREDLWIGVLLTLDHDHSTLPWKYSQLQHHKHPAKTVMKQENSFQSKSECIIFKVDILITQNMQITAES